MKGLIPPAGALTKSKYAEHRGVTKGQVTHWHKAGRIKLTPDGRFVLVAESDRMLAESMAPDRGGKRGGLDRIHPVEGVGGGEPGGKRAAPGSPGVQEAPVDRPKAGMTFTEVRIAREAYVAKGAELDYLERVGQLVEKRRYDKALVDALGPAMAKLETLSTRVAPHVAEEDRRRVQSAIDVEVVGLRREIAAAIRMLTAGAAGQTRQ